MLLGKNLYQGIEIFVSLKACRKIDHTIADILRHRKQNIFSYGCDILPVASSLCKID